MFHHHSRSPGSVAGSTDQEWHFWKPCYPSSANAVAHPHFSMRFGCDHLNQVWNMKKCYTFIQSVCVPWIICSEQWRPPTNTDDFHCSNDQQCTVYWSHQDDDGVGISSCCRPRVLAEPRSPQARYIIMYFHCNGVDLGMCKGFCNVLRRQFRVHVCLDK